MYYGEKILSSVIFIHDDASLRIGAACSLPEQAGSIVEVGFLIGRYCRFLYLELGLGLGFAPLRSDIPSLLGLPSPLQFRTSARTYNPRPRSGTFSDGAQPTTSQSNAMLAIAAVVASKRQSCFIYYVKPLEKWMRETPIGNYARALALGAQVGEASPF